MFMLLLNFLIYYFCNLIQKDMSNNLVIKYKQEEIALEVSQENTIKWIKQQIRNKTKIPVLQQELSYKDGDKKIVITDNEMPFKFANFPTNTLAVKNLGKQIRWEMVFYIQYLGPILILPLFYLLGKKELYTDVQLTALILGVLHYIKRQYETAYVHVFSRQSMPFKRVIINSLHYWVLFALANSIELFFFPSGHTYPPSTIAILVALWALFQFLNYKCHTILGGFRRNKKEKTQGNAYENLAKTRQIPYGYGFDLVSCANYFWQALCWITYSVLTRNYTAYLFSIFSVVQMAIWALDKHKRYRKEFADKYPKNRKAMFPFLL